MISDVASYFKVDELYNRRNDIHLRFGGQRQGGISTPKDWQVIFLFTGDAGECFGYSDGWDAKNGVFRYTGEGQVGDMEFHMGNRAIRDHARAGKSLLLFQSLGKSKPVQFIGEFAAGSWEYGQSEDRNGNTRRSIVFHLTPLEKALAHALEGNELDPTLPLDELRRRAYAAAASAEQAAPKETKAVYRRRAASVKAYVLARAAGVCESCLKPAPFKRIDGSPYLEPHHVTRLADDGLDDPRWVGAVCPTCHREIHHGAGGDKLNSTLKERVFEIETAPR